jgi:phosphoribosylglycinamide formyltransferase 1
MNLALFISGGGSTAQAVIRSCQNGLLQGLIHPVLVISSNPNAGGIQKAKSLGIPVEIVQKEKYQDHVAFGVRLLSLLSQYNVDFISQNGWMPLTPKNVIEKYDKKIINQHPGPLDPGRLDFGGKGMYGARVTSARIIYAMLAQEEHPYTEATTHFVTEEFDNGDIIRVKQLEFTVFHEEIQSITIEQDKDLQSYIKHRTEEIHQALLPLEHENVIATLFDIVNKHVPHVTRTTPLIPEENKEILFHAKGLAIKLFP